MDWISAKRYDTVEAAVLGRSQQSELELLDPKPVRPESIAGIVHAAEVITIAISVTPMPVVIVGDYDADGITSTHNGMVWFGSCDIWAVSPKPSFHGDFQTVMVYRSDCWMAFGILLS